MSPPSGVTINPATRTITFDTNALAEQSGTVITVRAVDQYGRNPGDRTFTLGIALPALGSFGALASQTFADNTGNQTYVFPAATGAGLTWTYALTAPPSGVTIDSGTRTITFDTNALAEQSGTMITVSATDQYGRPATGSPRSFLLDITAPVTVADLAITAANQPVPDGDVNITYTIDIASDVDFWIAPASTPDPDDLADLNSAPFVLQGTVSLTNPGSSLELDPIVGAWNGSVKLYGLPDGGAIGDLAISPSFTLVVSGWAISGSSITSSPTIAPPVVSGSSITG